MQHIEVGANVKNSAVLLRGFLLLQAFASAVSPTWQMVKEVARRKHLAFKRRERMRRKREIQRLQEVFKAGIASLEVQRFVADFVNSLFTPGAHCSQQLDPDEADASAAFRVGICTNPLWASCD